MKRLITVLAAGFIASTSLAAKDGHKHGDEHKPKYGGMVKEVNEIQYELVAKPDSVVVYVEDHGKKVDTNGATGKITAPRGSAASPG